MDVLLIGLAVAGVIAILGLALFFGFKKPDPTKANQALERKEEEARSRSRRSRLWDGK